MNSHTLEFPFTSRYYSLGRISEKTNHIWIACHGYGQLARYFINKFHVLDLEQHYILAPEGTNRFYLEGFNGRVGATWMTKEDRETDIANYLCQLNYLLSYIPQDFRDNCKIHLLGFSQGTATLTRWVMSGEFSFDSLIIWAGQIANEISLDELNKKLKGKKVFYVSGNDDEFYTIGAVRKYFNELRTEISQLEFLLFEGKHTLDPAALKKLESAIV